MAMAKKKDFLTAADERPQMTLENGSVFPNKKNIPGDSVNGHKELEEANMIITGDEIRQQNENL
ncbi:hypothetical protein [Neobacillus drentensis]|uniref:hypothetical protein n=1 Tax=Neobacillus drentensis TaxID=220684 RepID=UPI003D2F905C